jgi:hypothetical protein
VASRPDVGPPSALVVAGGMNENVGRKSATGRHVKTGIGSMPADFRLRVQERIFYGPEPTTGLDRSLRRYIHAASYGRARLDATIVDPVQVTWAMHGTPPQANPGQTMEDAIRAAHSDVRRRAANERRRFDGRVGSR